MGGKGPRLLDQEPQMLLRLLEVHLDPPTQRIDLEHLARREPRVSAQKQRPVLLPDLGLAGLVHPPDKQ